MYSPTDSTPLQSKKIRKRINGIERIVAAAAAAAAALRTSRDANLTQAPSALVEP